MTDRLASRPLRRAPWRPWLVGCLLLSVAWPAIGPVPWLADFMSDDLSGVARHHDASGIPGSPTHPDDHNCFQCEVIKHLARCVPSDGCFPVLAPVIANPPQPPIRTGSAHGAFVVPRPPIRGPPPLNG